MLIPAPIRNLYERWLARRLPPARQVVLDQRRIFIFPTGYGFFYLLVSALLFIGGINYENNLILALAFLLASLFMVAILHTFRNLSALGMRNGDSESGFAGEEGALEIVLFAQRRDHHCVWLRWPDQDGQQISIRRGEEESLWLNLPLPERGRVTAPRLRVESRFPLGLLRSWSYVSMDHYCLAWPRPQESPDCPADGGKENQQSFSSGQTGNDEFQGLRTTQRGIPCDGSTGKDTRGAVG